MGRIVTWLQQCSENPEFGTTLARRLNQSRASAVLQSNLIAIKFGTAEARRLNWASVVLSNLVSARTWQLWPNFNFSSCNPFPSPTTLSRDSFNAVV